MFSPLVIAQNQKAKCQTNRLPGVKASGKQIIWIKKLTKNRIKKLNAKQIEYFAWYTYLSHLASTPCMVVASTASWAPAALASIERLSSSTPRTSEPRIHLAWRRAPLDWCVHPQTTSQDKEYYDWELCVPTLCLQPLPFYSSKSGEHLFVPSDTVYAGAAGGGDAPPQKIVFEPRVAAPNPKDLQLVDIYWGKRPIKHDWSLNFA